MKVAVTSKGTTLDAQVDPRFGRCASFVIVETDDMSFEARAFSRHNGLLTRTRPRFSRAIAGRTRSELWKPQGSKW